MCDYFPPERRATAIGITAVGSAIGVLFASAGSGWLVEHFGWRAAFMTVGIPGLVLALLFVTTIREPRRGPYDAVAPSAAVPPLMTVVSGLALFLHPLLVRHYRLDYALAGLAFGVVTAASYGFGCRGGGLLADRLTVRDVRQFGWIPLAGLSAAAAACAPRQPPCSHSGPLSYVGPVRQRSRRRLAQHPAAVATRVVVGRLARSPGHAPSAA